MEERANNHTPPPNAIELTRLNNTTPLTRTTKPLNTDKALLVLALVASQHPELAITIVKAYPNKVDPFYTNPGRVATLKAKMENQYYLDNETVNKIARGVVDKKLDSGYFGTLVCALNTQIQDYHCYTIPGIKKPAQARQALLKTLFLLRLLIVPLKHQTFSWSEHKTIAINTRIGIYYGNFKIIKRMDHPETLNLYLKCCSYLRFSDSVKFRIQDVYDTFFKNDGRQSARQNHHNSDNDIVTNLCNISNDM